jgi:hypothetical protein
MEMPSKEKKISSILDLKYYVTWNIYVKSTEFYFHLLASLNILILHLYF